jgi:hypothetical protein
MKRRRKQSERDKELADNARLLRRWKAFHREQLETALAGVHRDVFERLQAELKSLHSARELVAFIDAQDWSAMDANIQLIALHEINAAICRLRERRGLEPIDDALPGQPPTAFQIIRSIITKFPAAMRGSQPEHSRSNSVWTKGEVT